MPPTTGQSKASERESSTARSGAAAGPTRGARTHERLVSVLRTTAQQGGDAMAILGELIRSPVPMVARLNLPVLRLP